MTILGVDPGFLYAGYGVIIQQSDRKTFLADHGYLRMTSKQSLMKRTGMFYSFFKQKIVEYAVTHIALETPFLGKNAQNFLKLGYLRGILYLLCDQHALAIDGFAPRQIKQALTGFGAASKEQVAHVVISLFPALKRQKRDDVTDAIAVTLCSLWQQKLSLHHKII